MESNTEKSPVLHSRLRAIAFFCAGLTLVASLLTFAGWVGGLPLLASVRGTYIPMAPSTAFCFLFVALSLLFLLRRPLSWWLVRGFASIVLFFALTKLVEIFGGYHFGIDAWFVRNPQLFGAVPTGRMAPLTAMNFVFVAAGLFGLTDRPQTKSAGSLGAVAMVVSLVVLVGYWYGTPLLYGGKIIPVAFSTACAFLLSGLGIVAAAGPRAWPLRSFLGDNPRPLLLRAFVPWLVGAGLINGWVNVWLPSHIHTNPAVTSALCAIIFTALLTWSISQVSRLVGGRLDRAEAARSAVQAELVALNAQLEERVRDRTRALQEKNRQMQEELLMARELQLALLPQKFPSIPEGAPPGESALKFLSLYYPTGDVSGDFFSIFPVGKKAAGVFICDVMGHGVRSALVTSMIRGLIREHAPVARQPGELLTKVNHALTDIFRQADTTMFATCFYLVTDVEQGRLHYANAGHPYALHLHHTDATSEAMKGVRGPAMGIFPEVRYSTTSCSVAKGDRIILFTDGLFEVESAGGNLFTEEKLRETVQQHAGYAGEEFFERVIGNVRAFSQREAFEDDVCIVGIEVRETDA